MRRAAWFTFALIALPALAQSGATGNWSGTYSYSVQLSNCSNKTFNASGAASMTILQTGNSISGRIDLADYLTLSSNCTAGTADVTRTIVGTVSAGAIAWSIPNRASQSQFSGSIENDTIVARWTDANGGAGEVTLTRVKGDPLSVDVTGSWSGTYSFVDRCANGSTQSYNGAWTFALTQKGANAGGVVTMKAVPLYDQNCKRISTIDMTMPVAGAVSGATFSGGVFEPSGSFEFPITATLTAGSMSGAVSGANQTGTTGTFTANRDSAAPPASDFGGSYDGTYTERDNESFQCINIGFLTFSDDASMTIVQGGNAIAGWLIFHNSLGVVSDGFGNCAAVNAGDDVLPLYGTLNGNTFTATVPIGANIALQTTVTITGNLATGSLVDSAGDQGQFNVVRNAAEGPPGPRRRAVRH